jgi:hypothetical protein
LPIGRKQLKYPSAAAGNRPKQIGRRWAEPGKGLGTATQAPAMKGDIHDAQRTPGT